MRSWRIALSRLVVDGAELDMTYAEVFVVIHEGDVIPGPSDWEATIRTRRAHRLAAGTYELLGEAPDGSRLEGHAVLRFSDGRQHLFRGDGPLAGFDPAA